MNREREIYISWGSYIVMVDMLCCAFNEVSYLEMDMCCIT